MESGAAAVFGNQLAGDPIYGLRQYPASRLEDAKHVSVGGHGGSIVLMSSVASYIGGAGEWLHYAATKGAINTFTLGLAREVAGEGIRVNAVSPGVIDTEIHAAAGAGDRVARLVPNLPMPRIGTAREVAEAILFFMGDEAAYSIGAVLPITGGR